GGLPISPSFGFGGAADFGIYLLGFLQVLLELGQHLGRPLLYITILGVLRSVLEVLYIFLMVLDHAVHVVLIQLLARFTAEFILQDFGIVRHAIRQSNVLGLRKLLQFVQGLAVVIHHHLGE